MKRREFLKSAAATAGAAALVVPPQAGAAPAGAWAPAGAPYDPKGLPTVVLGKTGARVPRIGIGCGSRFCAVQDRDTAVAILHSALDHGFYYWDTAASYRNKDIISEERLGLVLQDRRREVFLASKTDDRSYDGAMRQFETSLKRLRTDRLDLYQVHLVESLADVEAIGAERGVLMALRKLRDDKAVRFIGFTGHLSAEAMAETARRFDFDTMLISLNHYQEVKGDMEKGAVPVAAAKGLGVMLIKLVRPRETVKEVSAETLIRYGLSLEGAHAAVIGTDSLDVVRKNAALLKEFRPLEPEEMSAVRRGLGPFFAGLDVPWMRPLYKE
jgi:predicted aldo/keto reductase-like oxidoreductase